jgi:hypothetical protein
MIETLNEDNAQEVCVAKRALSVTKQARPKRQYRRKTTLAPDRIPNDTPMTPAPALPEQPVQQPNPYPQPNQILQANQNNPPNKVNVKRRGKARRLPVQIKKSPVWNKLKESTANISLAEWLAIDPNAQKDMVDGIRYLRENKKRKDKQVGNTEIEQGQKVNKVDINKEETENEESNSDSSINSNLETDSGVTSIDSTHNNEEEDYWSDDSDIRSVYRYPYSLERMKNSSPLKAMISIQGRPVEAVFDSGAAVSVIGGGLADELGLTPNGDILPLVGIDPGKNVTYSKIVMDVPLNLGGKIRPDHMTILEGNDKLCLIGIPFFQSFGVSIDLEKSTIHVPTTDGEVIIQGFTSHQPNAPVKTDDQVLPLIDTKPAVNHNKARKSNECYNVDLGDSQTDEYDDIFVPNNGDEEPVIKFTEDNIADGVPLPLVDQIEEYKGIFSEVSGLSKVKNYQKNIELKPGRIKNYQMDIELKPGRLKNYQMNIELKPGSVPIQPETLVKCISKLQIDRKDLLEKARITSDDRKAKNKINYDGKVFFPQKFEVGDRVLLKEMILQEKLADTWIGPFTVIKCNQNGTVHLVGKNSRKIQGAINGDRLKPFREHRNMIPEVQPIHKEAYQRWKTRRNEVYTVCAPSEFKSGRAVSVVKDYRQDRLEHYAHDNMIFKQTNWQKTKRRNGS